MPGDWYGIQAKRHSEGRVHQNLARRSIAAFLPLIEVKRRNRSRRAVTFLEPLFPGYMFVQTDRTEIDSGFWHTVRWTPGVRLILGMEDTPTPIPDAAIEAIQDRVRTLGFVRPGARYANGSHITFKRGPLEGLCAVFDCPVSHSGRVRVLLELMGQQTSVEVDDLDLDPV